MYQLWSKSDSPFQLVKHHCCWMPNIHKSHLSVGIVTDSDTRQIHSKVRLFYSQDRNLFTKIQTKHANNFCSAYSLNGSICQYKNHGNSFTSHEWKSESSTATTASRATILPSTTNIRTYRCKLNATFTNIKSTTTNTILWPYYYCFRGIIWEMLVLRSKFVVSTHTHTLPIALFGALWKCS